MKKLEKQKPVGKFVFEPMGERWHHIKHGEAQHAEPKLQLVKLFTHPAPAADLAEMVPEQALNGQARFLGDKEPYYNRGWNDCRAEMLRNIAQADRDKFFKFLKDTSAIVDSWPDWKKQGSDVVKFLSQSPPAGVVEEPCPKGSVHEWVHHAPCYNPDYEECNKCGQRKECSENE